METVRTPEEEPEYKISQRKEIFNTLRGLKNNKTEKLSFEFKKIKILHRGELAASEIKARSGKKSEAVN